LSEGESAAAYLLAEAARIELGLPTVRPSSAVCHWAAPGCTRRMR
jgi:hypothetical protein